MASKKNKSTAALAEAAKNEVVNLAEERKRRGRPKGTKNKPKVFYGPIHDPNYVAPSKRGRKAGSVAKKKAAKTGKLRDAITVVAEAQRLLGEVGCKPVSTRGKKK